MSRTDAAEPAQHHRLSRVPRLARRAAIVLFAGGLLAACADSVANPVPRTAASDSELLQDKETIAGEEIELTAGSCPKGYALTLTKKGNNVDQNDNGWICVSKSGDAVDDVVAEGAGTCPDDYELLRAKPGSLDDVNGNGWVCFGNEEVIDDQLVDEDRMMVNGHGNVVVTGKLGAQDISFSFHAIPMGTDFDGKGKFEFHDQLNGLNVHGSVECVATQAGNAFIAATVTRSDDAGLPVGAIVGWFARDVAEPGAGFDAVTRPSRLKVKFGDSACGGVKFPTMSVILNGNIQVH